jgi:ferredoxin-NADP reductase
LVTSGWKVGTVTATRTQTPTGRSIDLAVPGWPGNVAGQHVDVRLTAPDGYRAVRSYSLASSGPGESIQLAVDRLPEGEVSPYLVDDLRPGDQLEFRGPLGGWFVWRPEQVENVQLIGGGSGVVPLVAMVRSHAASGSAAKFRLLYSVRAPEDAFFADELAALESDTFELTWAYTRAVPAGWPAAPGRVNRELVERVTFAPSPNLTTFICGPTGFVEAVSNILVDTGHDPARVKTERFGGA